MIEDDSTENLVTDIETQVGAIESAVCNLGARIGDWGLADTSLKALEMGWRTAVDAHRKLVHFWTGV